MSGPLVALPSGMDAGTAELILAMPCESDDDVTRWFGLVEESYTACQDDFDAFVTRLREQAAAFDQSAVDAFVEYAESTGGLQVVARVLEHLPAHPEIYWDLTAPADDAEAGPFDWLGQDQIDRLAAGWGSDWPTYLNSALDDRWGADWQANPAEHKQAWLTDILDELLAQNGEQVADADGDPFGWVATDQVTRLSNVWGAEWQSPLADELDQRWGADWQANPAEHKQAWLADVLDEILDAATGADDDDDDDDVDYENISLDDL